MKITLSFIFSIILFIGKISAQQWHKYADFPVNTIPQDISANNDGTLFMLSTNKNIFYKTISGEWKKMGGYYGDANCISADITTNRLFVGTNSGGLFHTNNFGASWSNSFVNTNPHTGFHETYNLISNIRSSNLVFATYAGTNQLVRFTNQGNLGQSKTVNTDTGYQILDLHYTQNDKLLVGSNQGIWISENNGNTYAVSGLEGLNTYSLTESPDGQIYLLSVNGSGTNQLWKSTNDLYDEWVELDLPNQGNSFQMVYFDKSSSQLWLADQSSIYKSGVETINWTDGNFNQNNSTVVGFTDDNNGKFFSFTRENNCLNLQNNSWETANDGLMGEIHEILLDDNNKLFAANNYYSNKLAFMNSVSDDWNYTTIGLYGLHNLMKWEDNSILLNQWDKIFRSTDGGDQFSELDLPEEFNGQPNGGIGLMKKGESGALFVTHSFIPEKLFITHDLGETWESSSLIADVQDIAETADGTYIAVIWGQDTSFSSEIHYSTDQGATWEKLENDIIDFTSGILKLTVGENRCFIQVFNKIYEINVQNETLTVIPLPFNQFENTDMQFSINDLGEMFITSSDQNLYRSANNGENWTNLGKPTGVSDAYFGSLTFGYGGTPFVIYSAYNSTNTLQGIYYYGDEIMQTHDVIHENEFTVYPNPSQNEVFIKTKFRGEVALYDWEGKLILKKLILQPVSSIPIVNLPKGIYILKDSNGNSFKILKQ